MECAAFECRGKAGNSVREVRIDSEFDVGRAAWVADHRIVERLQIDHALADALVPEVVEGHGAVGAVEAPQPVSDAAVLNARAGFLEGLGPVLQARWMHCR